MSKSKVDFRDGEVCPEPLTSIISICFTATEKAEWVELNDRIKAVNKRAHIAEYGRRYLRECMADIKKSLEAINPHRRSE